VLAVALFACVGWQALNGPSEPPVLVVEVSAIQQTAGGYRVDFVIRNDAASAAAQVEVEGTLEQEGGAEQTGRASFDYIPGDSERHGGVFFKDDPRRGRLTLRATGYAAP
jgi:uncharacterized protein (TIGR02588 family)